MTDPEGDPESGVPPAFYAQPTFLSRAIWRDWWTVLHPPYTLWHLSYVVIGSCLDPPVDATRLAITVVAFFLAVGVGAHALDELHGRPLRTNISTNALRVAAIVGIGGAAALGIAALLGVGGTHRIGWPLIPFIVVGIVLAVSYNLELFGGRLHTDFVFAAAWGAFPVLTGYFTQHERLNLTAGAAAIFAFFLSSAQRHLSTPARALRRKTRHIEGVIVHLDGTSEQIDRAALLIPFEGALRALMWSVVALATTLVIARLRH